MGALDIIALLMLLLLAVLIGALLWFLGGLPGRVAKERSHPYEQAIDVGGWATLLLAGVFWPVVLIWAYAPSQPGASRAASPGRDDELKSEIESLRRQVESLTRQIPTQEGGEQ